MRVFVAMDVPPQIKKALGDVQQELRPSTQMARWVSLESIHITLKFIGEIAEQRVEEIDAAIRIAWKAFTVRVHGVGFFPNSRSPRVFWAGLDAPEITDLAVELDRRLEQLGFEREKRALHPHLTLARARDHRIDQSLALAASRFEKHEFGSFTADRFFLFQSTLRPAGAIYTKLKEYALER